MEYHFTDEAGLARLQEEDRVIEIRAYDTVYGVWKYFTVWEEQMNLERESYCLIGTLEAWNAMCQYFGREKMIPVYIEVEDGDASDPCCREGTAAGACQDTKSCAGDFWQTRRIFLKKILKTPESPDDLKIKT